MKMTWKHWLVFFVGILLLALIFPVLPIFLWVLLAASAWYVKRIPEKRLPLATFWATHQPTFYNWLAAFLSDWARLPKFASVVLLMLGILGWGILSLRLIPLPIYGANIEIKDSTDATVGAYTTTGNEPYCFNNLSLGKYTISQIVPPGFAASTQNVVTATIQPDSMTLVEFGDSNVSVPPTPIVRPPVTAQFKVDSQKPAPGSLCVLAWSDLNGNAIREAGEPLIPEIVLPLQNVDEKVRFLGLLFLVIDLFAFQQAKFMAWDAKVWQAEPTGRALAGVEFDELTEEQKQQLYHHVAEASIGINKGTWVVSDGKAELKQAPADTFAKFGGPGVLIVQEGHAVVLERGGRISRIVGAGHHSLGPFERVNMVVYLLSRVERVHIKDALTRDKMVLEDFELLVFHRADRGDESETSGQYRYDPKVIRGSIWNPKGGDWRETVQSVSDSAARDVIGQYNFEDIVSISGEGRRKLILEFTARINAITKNLLGVEVVGVNIGAITISNEAKRALEVKGLSEVERQTAIMNAEAQKEAMARRGEGQALAIRRLEQEKAPIRKELIQQLMEALKPFTDQVKGDTNVANNVIAAVERLLERLEATMVRDDLDMARYSEMLEKIKDVEGPKTVILGDTKGITTSMDVQQK